MVGAGRERSEAPTSARGGRGSSIPPQSLRRALDLSMQTPPAVASSSAGRGRGGRRRRRLVEVDVAAGEVGRLLLRLPRRHPQLIHPTTPVLRLRWSRMRWTRLGLRSTSLGATSLWQTRLRPTSLGPTSVEPPSLRPTRLRPTRLRSSAGITLSRSGTHVRVRRVVVVRVAIVLTAIARVRGLRGAKSTSVVVQSSRPPRRPPTRGG
jgi:hypothetical protein